MIRERAFDAAEMGLTYYLRTLDFDNPPFVALPIFLARAFRHASVFVNVHSGIQGPGDLAEFDQVAGIEGGATPGLSSIFRITSQECARGKSSANSPCTATMPASGPKASSWMNTDGARNRAAGSSALRTGICRLSTSSPHEQAITPTRKDYRSAILNRTLPMWMCSPALLPLCGEGESAWFPAFRETHSMCHAPFLATVLAPQSSVWNLVDFRCALL